jgi:hypothetical protein
MDKRAVDLWFRYALRDVEAERARDRDREERARLWLVAGWGFLGLVAIVAALVIG